MIEDHPLAELLPSFDEARFNELCHSIKDYGLDYPVTLYQEKILDGRHRYRACLKVGVEPRFEAFTGDDDSALQLVIRRNIRRDMTPSQRAIFVAKAMSVFEDQARERQREGGEKAGRGRPDRSAPHGADLSEPEPHRASEDAAKAAGVGARTVERAKKVVATGIPELVKAVEDGVITVNAAEKIADMQEEVQREEIEKAKMPPEKKLRPTKRHEDDERPNLEKGKGVGIYKAYEATNILQTIPNDDPQRSDAMKIVTNWIKANS
jgi:ParB-like chromosome segregation protein Spo0J